MASRLTRLFSPFEGETTALPLAVFRIAFYGGLAIHFLPAIFRGDAYSPGALRTEEWSHYLFLHFSRLPHGALSALGLLTFAAILLGLLGLWPRIAALGSFAGLYAFASFNGLPVQTLALLDVWAILILWAICGGGDRALSIAALRHPERARKEPRLLPSLILYQIVLAVFFSGIEKLLAGWPGSNEMGLILSYPKGFLVRDWVFATAFLHGRALTSALSWLTLLVELGTPILLFWQRTRLYALAVYQLFFLGIIAMLEVPPLFYFIFAAGALLALSDRDLARLKDAVGSRSRGADPAAGAR